jgi:putative phosphoribosyl transferase
VIEALGISADEIETETRKERAEAERRERLYRGNRPPLNVEGRTIILVDDGVATGSTIKAGIAALKQLKVGRIVVAVPVAPTSTIEELKMEADEVVCVSTPEPFFAIGLWYEEFPQTTDEEVRDLLKKAEMKKEAVAG